MWKNIRVYNTHPLTVMYWRTIVQAISKPFYSFVDIDSLLGCIYTAVG